MVSVIITTYNYASYVERAIRSIVDQSLPKNQFEILVVNDCSTDHTEEILDNWKDSIRVYNLEENVGLAGARNFGIRKARGQYVIFVDADDYVHSDLLRVQKLFLDLNNDIDAVSTDYFIVSDKGKHLKHVNAEEEPIACGIMFRKDYLYQIGFYDEEFRAREEEDLRIRWQSKYNIHNVIIPLYRYWMHTENLTKNEAEMDKFKQKLEEKHG
ncbi:MAG: glycosyltransferase family 2 protein [Flavobacteriales bacterium]|nr:glycosyltransferase family 2 protein [Flavobacteriales bacterium]